MKQFDYIIVGGGSAGSVLANRLSARSANEVLVCEAGEDTPPGRVPGEILDSYPGTAYLNPRFHWTELKVSTEVVSHNRDPGTPPPKLRKYEQARVLGGGSSINGQMANRGAPTDYDEWQERGAAGWHWDAVLPYFKKVERDVDIDDELPGFPIDLPAQAGDLARIRPVRLGAEDNAGRLLGVQRGHLRLVHPGIDPQNARVDQRENRAARYNDIARISLPR